MLPQNCECGDGMESKALIWTVNNREPILDSLTNLKLPDWNDDLIYFTRFFPSSIWLDSPLGFSPSYSMLIVSIANNPSNYLVSQTCCNKVNTKKRMCCSFGNELKPVGSQDSSPWKLPEPVRQSIRWARTIIGFLRKARVNSTSV